MDRSSKQRLANRVFDGTLVEIAQEKAASLGRAGQRVEAALARLRRHEQIHGRLDGWADVADEAARAVYYYIVQREACGLRNSSELLRELDVPAEIQLRMGTGRSR
jgi:hypothetical protein